MASLTLAYQDALESAVVRVSKSRLSSPAQQTLASRIESALEELDKLRLGQIPNYASPDVALLYSHWYLPEQVNLAYTLSAALIAQRGEGWQAGRSMQLIDFGAGSGAMVLGLTLAIAHHLPRERWPNVVAVYQIDDRSMLDVGDQIWRSLALEVSSRNDLSPVASLMSRMLFERTGVPPEPEAVWSSLTERWLTALHVVYEQTLQDTVTIHGRLLEFFRPNVSIVTAPQLKANQIVDAQLVNTTLGGTADKIRRHRTTLATTLDSYLSGKAANYLTGEIRWSSRYGNKRPVASTVVRDWGSR